MITVQRLTSERFRSSQDLYQVSNFLQTTEMKEVQESLGRFTRIELVGFFDEEKLIGQATIVYRKRYRFFTEALVLHGPLLDYQQAELVLQVIDALEHYVKKQRVAQLHLYPYALQTRKNEQLEMIEDHLQEAWTGKLPQKGYQHRFDPSQSTVVNTIFVKDLSDYTSVEEIHDRFSNSLKRDLKKFEEMHVHVKELSLDNLDEFYQLLKQTSERKGFGVQPFSYFRSIKEAYGDRAKFMLAYLDYPAYLTYLTERVAFFEDTIRQLQAGPQKKRTKGQIADAEDQLRSYYKRLDQLKNLNLSSDEIPLSSYVFLCNCHEFVSFSGGNDEALMNFGGATLIHWQMIQEAYAAGAKRLNFYGTIETEAATKGKGNFKFKSQFGGELHLLVGEYSKIFSLLYRMISFVKKSN